MSKRTVAGLKVLLIAALAAVHGTVAAGDVSVVAAQAHPSGDGVLSVRRDAKPR